MPDSAPPVKIISPRRSLIVLLVLCMVFTALGVVILVLAPTKTLNALVGTGSIAFFGIGGGIAFVTQWRRTHVITADQDGIRLGEGGRIAWQDVDRIGSTSQLLGIRLRRYEDFLDSTPRNAGHSAATLRESRARNAGWDLVWPQRLLDRTPGEAARDLQRCRPST
jgi:hypothetical protein